MPKLLLLNGPNLNLLGTREPEKYGNKTLASIEKELMVYANQHHSELKCFQSNAEHELIEQIHHCQNQQIDFIIFNPAAFTHTSIALRDALLAVNIPFIEIHLSNTHQREKFRQHSYFSDIAEGVIIGLGSTGYRLALQAAIDKLNRE
ncbi:MAG: type II 3-dehydroquinate dehydratase [Thiotrichaceae bacterium]|nr:type II 3-dehydroquinate dehydratase [Thiotrichaceae bacterium]